MRGHNKSGYHRPRQLSDFHRYSLYRFETPRYHFEGSGASSHTPKILKKSRSPSLAPQSYGRYDFSNEFACSSVAEHAPSPSAVRPGFFSASDVISDEEAAKSVERHLRSTDSCPRRRYAAQELIRLILSSPFEQRRVPEVLELANVVFFEGLVTPNLWPLRWRPSSSSESSDNIIGTTELRRTRSGRFETRITLSTSILHSSAYDQRLVLSAVLHEAIHSYLFVRRGFAATKDGGHSEGFRHIARLIDEWIGDESYLQLQRTEAILEEFETRSGSGWSHDTSAWGTEKHGFKWIGSNWVLKADIGVCVHVSASLDTASSSPPFR